MLTSMDRIILTFGGRSTFLDIIIGCVPQEQSIVVLDNRLMLLLNRDVLFGTLKLVLGFGNGVRDDGPVRGPGGGVQARLDSLSRFLVLPKRYIRIDELIVKCSLGRKVVLENNVTR